VILIQRGGGDVPQPELFIGPDSIEVVPKVRNLGFVLNKNLTPVDHYKAVCQRIYSVLRSVKPHARYTPFGVRKKLVVSLVIPHINYGNVVLSIVDSASQRRLNVAFNSCLRYVHDIPRREHVSHLAPTIISVSLATHLKIHLLTLLFKVLHIRHPCYLFTLFHFASLACTRNLIVTPHRSLAMGHSFTVGACGLWISLPRRIKNKRALGRFVGLVRTHFT
jgi:hypothetical protein